MKGESMNLRAQIIKEFQAKDVTNIEYHGNTGLITFLINGKEYWAKLTPTGRVKKNSIRINNF